jgi:hypothetical protein
MEQAEQQFDGRGLAGAVRAQQTEDLAPAHFEVNLIDGAGFGAAPEIFEDLGETADDDDGGFGLWVADCGLGSPGVGFRI